MRTSWVLRWSRLAFVIYFAVVFGSHLLPVLPYIRQHVPIVWGLYMLVIYYSSERTYAIFKQRGIDLAFAFPLLFFVVSLNFVSILVRGQERFPLVNRAEHFTTFILLAYIVWVFFLKYLPQKVWQNHPYYTAILVLSVTSLVGVGNEIAELFMDVNFGTHTIGPGYDTSLDVLMNTLGSGLFLAVQLILHEANIRYIG